jgi:hypothetical protein
MSQQFALLDQALILNQAFLEFGLQIIKGLLCDLPQILQLLLGVEGGKDIMNPFGDALLHLIERYCLSLGILLLEGLKFII